MPTAAGKYFLIVSLLALQVNVFPQSNSFPLDDWAKKLGNVKAPLYSGVYSIADSLIHHDSATVVSLFADLEKKGAKAGKYFDLRFQLLKAQWIGLRHSCAGASEINEINRKALDIAYGLNNDSLVAQISWNYGGGMYQCKRMEYAAFYCLLAVETDEKSRREIPQDRFRLLGDVLYNTRDYERSIYYTRNAMLDEKDTSWNIRHYNMSLYNTIGLCWHKSGNFDSAFSNYRRALQLANLNRNTVWEAIISGNMGQAYYTLKQYDVAKPMLEFDYRESKAYGEWANAANSLQWVARINLAQGKNDSALIQVREALTLLQSFSEYRPFYLQNVYYALTDVYRSSGEQDSVIKYSELYNHLHDSIERAVANSRLEIARIKLDNMQHEQSIKNLNREKESEKLKRNLIIVIIILVAIIALFYFNRQRLKHRHNEQLALQQKTVAEKETAFANSELNSFKKNIIEKTSLIEKLQQQVDQNKASIDHQQVIDELTHQTILTENDWEKFKSLFEKINPGFFTHLKQKAPDITVAEQRMAALTRLHLTNSQMASMLGISPDSVQKSKRRLRLRLQLGDEINLEEFLAHS